MWKNSICDRRNFTSWILFRINLFDFAQNFRNVAQTLVIFPNFQGHAEQHGRSFTALVELQSPLLEKV